MDMSPRHYTPAEAAAVSGVAVKAVHNAIDKHIIVPVDARLYGKKRRLGDEALLRLKLWYGVGATLTSARRERLFDEIKAAPTANSVRADDLLIIDVAEARRQIQTKIRMLDEAEAAVRASKDVLGGVPVFKGTRIPVRLVASMIAQGASTEEILSGYPKLDTHLLELAQIWVTAHPVVGRPAKLPEDAYILKSSRRVRLEGLGADDTE